MYRNILRVQSVVIDEFREVGIQNGAEEHSAKDENETTGTAVSSALQNQKQLLISSMERCKCRRRTSKTKKEVSSEPAKFGRSIPAFFRFFYICCGGKGMHSLILAHNLVLATLSSE